MKKIVAISDVHGKWNKLTIPPCDLLISTGDYSFKGEFHMVKDFHNWLNRQPAKDIISIQGNHEVLVEKHFYSAQAIALEECPRVHFIEEGLVEVQGLRIWCSSMTPWFWDWAYNRARNQTEADYRNIPLIKKHWDLIPSDIDILATHGPAYGILDELEYIDGTPKGVHVGCQDLLEKIKQIKVPIHLSGHIHSGYGNIKIEATHYYNASICDEMYCPTNEITIINYDK